MLNRTFKGRAKFHQDFNILSIEIPSRRNTLSIIIMTVWLGGWLMGEIFAYTSLIDGDTPLVAKAFLVVWLLAWTAGGLFVVYSILYQLFGKETFLLERGEVTIEKSIFGLGKEYHYDLRKIKNISLSQGNKGNQTNNLGFKKGVLKFEYNDKVVKFASGISQKEATRILEKLKSSGKFSRDNFDGEW